MTSQSSPTVDAGSLAVRAATYALAVLAEVQEGDLARPTPCADWDVRDLLRHIADASDLLASVAATGEPGAPGPEPRVGTAPATHAAERIQHLLGSLSESPNTEWAAQAGFGTAIELTTHAFDLAVASGSTSEPPADLVEEVHALAASLISDDARRPHFGPRIDVSPEAPATERLMAFLGRSPTR